MIAYIVTEHFCMIGRVEIFNVVEAYASEKSARECINKSYKDFLDQCDKSYHPGFDKELVLRSSHNIVSILGQDGCYAKWEIIPLSIKEK